jgi:hypothetical protein
MRARVSGFVAGGARETARGNVVGPGELADVADAADCVDADGRIGPALRRIHVQAGQDAVFHGSAKQIHLRWRRPADLDVFRTHSIQVFARCGMCNAQLAGHGLQRQAGCVQVQHISLTATQLRLGEVVVRIDRAGPLQVVENLAGGDGGDGSHDSGSRGGLGNHSSGAGRERFPHAGHAIGNAVHEHGQSAGLEPLDVVRDDRAVAEGEV